MFKHSTTSGRTRRALLRALAFASAVLLPNLAFAGPPAPMVMGPLYEEPQHTAADGPQTAHPTGCPMTILAVSGPRRAPETVGIVATSRGVSAPADREAWLHSVFAVGFGARGFTTTFAPPGAQASPDALTVSIEVRSIWVSNPGMNKAGSVVVHVSGGHGARTLDQFYRGDFVGANWAGTQSEFNGMLNRTFAQALDSIAADLRPLCSAT